jgi:hypothetical protein
VNSFSAVYLSALSASTLCNPPVSSVDFSVGIADILYSRLQTRANLPHGEDDLLTKPYRRDDMGCRRVGMLPER